MFRRFKISPIFWVRWTYNWYPRGRSHNSLVLQLECFPAFWAEFSLLVLVYWSLFPFIAGLTTDSLAPFSIKTCQIWLCWEFWEWGFYYPCVEQILQHSQEKTGRKADSIMCLELETRNTIIIFILSVPIIVINYWGGPSSLLRDFSLSNYVLFASLSSESWTDI